MDSPARRGGHSSRIRHSLGTGPPIRRGEAVLDGPPDCGGTPRDTDPLVRRADVALDRVHTDEVLSGYLLVGEALGDKAEDLHLAVRQADIPANQAGRSLGVSRSDSGVRAAVSQPPARHCRLDSGE